MKIERCEMPSFAVIGKEGSTDEGPGFVSRLWKEATEHFSEVQPLAQKDEHGQPVGFWGAMSDKGRSFLPWEDGFSNGLYLAGVQCGIDQEAPKGWCKWVIPAYEYLFVETEDAQTFGNMIHYLEENHFSLVGAVHDFICPQTGKEYQFFPIRKL